MSTEVVDGFAHCPDPLCDGYRQQEVRAIREEVGQSYTENGGDMPGIERSSVYLRFEASDEQPCPTCDRDRELSLTERKRYQPLSGQAQDVLLRLAERDRAA